MTAFTKSDVSKLKSIVSTGGGNYYNAGNGVGTVDAPHYTPGTIKPAHSGFIDKIKAVGGEALGLGLGAASAATNFVQNTPKYLYNDIHPFLQGVASAVTGEYNHDLSNIRDQEAQLEKNRATYTQLYKSGKMSKENYSRLLTGLGESFSALSDQSAAIAKKANPGTIPESAAMTAADILSAGSYKLATFGAKGAAEAATGGKEAISALIDSHATHLEKAVSNIPAVRALVLRNTTNLAKRGTQQLTGESDAQFIMRESKNLAVGLLLKRPILYQMNIASAGDVYNKILEGDVSSAVKIAALQATQMLEGGPIGAFLKGGHEVFGKLGSLSYGKGSLIDSLSKEIGNYEPNQIAKYLQSLPKDSEEFKNAEKVFRIMQETNLRVADEDIATAVRNILSNYDHAGVPRTELTPQKLLEDYNKWHQAAQLVDGLSNKSIPGIGSDARKNLVVVRWDSVMKRGLANAIEQAGNDRNAMAQVLTDFADQTTNGWTNNPTLMAQLTRIIDEADSAEQAANRIKSIPTALAIPDNIPKGVAKKLADLGYGVATPAGGVRTTPIVDYEDTRKLISAVTKGDEDGILFDPATAPIPAMATMTSALESAGLSPRAASETAYVNLSQNVVNTLDNLGVAKDLGFDNLNGSEVKGGQVILSKLQSYVNNKQANSIGSVLLFGKARPALTDIRQMTTKEIQEALSGGATKITTSEARGVSKAVMQGYLDTPLQYRGLGDKAVDAAYRYNPVHKYYSRIQSALRYSYNPFFQTQEGVETALLSGASGGNRATNLVDHHLMWHKSREELNSAVKVMDDSGMFSSSLGGEAAQDQIIGRLTADITNAQKRDLAGLALDLAKRRGTDLNTLIRENPGDVDDALRVIVQYPRKGLVASPLARTLSVAFFPMRYNFKVTKLAAEILAKQPPSVQLATIHSLMNLHDFIQSDEGIRWQSQYSDALQVFNWITPINSLDYVYNLLGQRPNSIASMGQLGGLPFGIIGQVLDSMGIIRLNTPYVNPKTGDILPKYIPETTKAKAATALTDLLGTMFTYPGRILGLPGKQQTLNDAVKRLISTDSSDYSVQDQTGYLTPMEQNMVRVLKGNTKQEDTDPLYVSPAPTQFPWYTLPPTQMPKTFIVPPKIKVNSRTNTAKKSAKKRKAKVYAQPI